MIIRYKEFIKENKNNEITSEEEELLRIYKITKYNFNLETNLIDVFQDVTFEHKIKHHVGDLTKIPKIRFGKIHGDFNCTDNKLTTLKGCPEKINGNFYCSNNELTSLEYCPTEIQGGFSCSYNNLTSLKYCPKIIINGGFFCHNNQLTSLEYCPKSINNSFTCSDNKLSSIEDYPLCIITGDISTIYHFGEVNDLIKENKDLFIPLLDDKNKFHQMIMRLDSNLIQYYKTILPPSRNSKLLI